MSTNINLKRSAVPSKVPLTTNLELGEVAINTYDGKMFFKKNDGSEAIVTLQEITENNLEIDSSSLNNATSNTLAGVLADFDSAITSSTGGGLTSGLTSVSTDTTISGDGTAGSPLSIGQSVTTSSNVQFDSITVTGTVDGRDVAADGTKLDTIETGADNYGGWGLYTDNTFRNNITSGENVNFLGGNSITISYSATNNITINHADTSTQASLTALTGANVVSDIDLDDFGHVTALSTRTMTLADFDANLSSFISTFTLPTVDGSNGQVLTTDGSGTLSFAESYSNSDVDAHLNTSTAANNQVLSWTGADYDWVDQSAGGGGITTSKAIAMAIVFG